MPTPSGGQFRAPSRRFAPPEAARAKARFDGCIAELNALKFFGYIELGKIIAGFPVGAFAHKALGNALRTVREEFGSDSHDAASFSKAMSQPMVVTHYIVPLGGALITLYLRRVTQGAVRGLEELKQRVDETTNSQIASSLPGPALPDPASRNRRIFVVHGHGEHAKEAVARILQKLDLDPVILQEEADRGRTTIEKLVAHADVGFAVVLMTGDDRGGPKGVRATAHRKRARQNVLVELGFFLGLLGRQKVCVLCEEGVERPSDYDGVLFKLLDADGLWRYALAKEINAAGIEVDLSRL